MQDGMALACVLHAHFADLIDFDGMAPGIVSKMMMNLY